MRWSSPHDVRTIEARERYVGEAPDALDGLPTPARLLAVHELRHAQMSWLWASPRSQAR